MKIMKNCAINSIWTEWVPIRPGVMSSRLNAVDYLSRWKDAQENKVRFMNPQYYLREYEWLNPIENGQIHVVGIKLVFDKAIEGDKEK